MLIVSFLIPPIMLWRTPEAAGAMGFTLTIIFSIFMLTQYVSLKEHQYPKAATLLCATPYPRRLIVLFKIFIFVWLFMRYAVLIFWDLTHFFFPKLGTFDIRMAVIIFFTVTVFLSVYFPALYKLDMKNKIFLCLSYYGIPYFVCSSV